MRFVLAGLIEELEQVRLQGSTDASAYLKDRFRPVTLLLPFLREARRLVVLSGGGIGFLTMWCSTFVMSRPLRTFVRMLSSCSPTRTV